MEYKDLSPAVQSEELLRQLIEEKIAEGETGFPSERMLETELGVSRTTLRRSLDTLEKEAVIQKRSRKGIEINQKQTINILKMNSMSSQLPGDQVVEVLSQKIVDGVEEVNQFLELAINRPLFKLVRRRIVDGKPFSYEVSYVDSARFAGIENIDLNNTSLYSVLEDEFGINPTYGREELRFVSANEKLTEALKIPLNTPLFEVVSKAFDQNDEPFEYSKQYLIGNQIKYKINAKNIFDYLEDE
ncbi:GntR family transcriptional regulator [Listeria welshimeri]|uniref:GntR family transcriptional regulator n=1 Tax=Listeria welshimeri TaxID=1643 RepID=UPI001889881A|nr:GntR family transcriptional regulator [Listeria welshimeri]MBF2638704.1 GntR family transcriptional regulator [Listeria welshimeri]